MEWDYANLSKEAKAAGGPYEYVEKIRNDGKEDGRIEAVICTGLILLCTKLAKKYGPIAVESLKKLWKGRVEQKREVKIAETELIQGINKYDASHPDDEDDPVDADKESTEI